MYSQVLAQPPLPARSPASARREARVDAAPTTPRQAPADCGARPTCPQLHKINVIFGLKKKETKGTFDKSSLSSAAEHPLLVIGQSLSLEPRSAADFLRPLQCSRSIEGTGNGPPYIASSVRSRHSRTFIPQRGTSTQRYSTLLQVKTWKSSIGLLYLVFP